MAAEIAVEEQRFKLIDHRIANERKDADSRAYAMTETLRPLRDLDSKTLMMLNGKNGDAKEMIALAFQQMAENAQKIGELNISPDLLTALIKPAPASTATMATVRK
jgi:20S proteasome alpha/beta subunit